MSWNIGVDKFLFRKLKMKLGLYHVVQRIPKTSPQTVTLTVVQMQQLTFVEDGTYLS